MSRRLVAASLMRRFQGRGLRAIGAALSANAGPDAAFVAGVAQLAGSASGGVPPYTYAWTVDSGGTGSFDDDTAADAIFTPDDDTAASVLLLTVTDDIANEASDSVAIAKTLAVDAGSDPAVWAAGVLTLAAPGASGGVPPYTYEWTISAGGAAAFGDDTSLTSIFTPDLPASYTLQIEVTDDSAQTAVDTVVIDATSAVVFTQIVLRLGGSQLQEFWLAHDAAQFRTITGSGVSDLIGQKAGTLAQQTVDARRPAMQAGAASNGRDQIRCLRSAQQYLRTSAGTFPMVAGERFGALSFGKFHTAVDSTTEEPHSLGNATNGTIISNWRNSTTPLVAGVHDSTGAFDTFSVGSDTASPQIIACFASDLHAGYGGGSLSLGARGQAISSRATGGESERYAMGSGVAGTGPCNLDLCGSSVWKLSGTAVPSAVTAVIAAIRSYYNEGGM